MRQRPITVPSGQTINFNDSWFVAGLMVDNPTGQWYYATGAERYIPPNAIGLSLAVYPAASTVSVKPTTPPPGGVANTSIGGNITVLFMDIPISENPGMDYSLLPAIQNLTVSLTATNALLTTANALATTNNTLVTSSNTKLDTLNTSLGTLDGSINLLADILDNLNLGSGGLARSGATSYYYSSTPPSGTPVLGTIIAAVPAKLIYITRVWAQILIALDNGAEKTFPVNFHLEVWNAAFTQLLFEGAPGMDGKMDMRFSPGSMFNSTVNSGIAVNFDGTQECVAGIQGTYSLIVEYYSE